MRKPTEAQLEIIGLTLVAATSVWYFFWEPRLYGLMGRVRAALLGY